MSRKRRKCSSSSGGGKAIGKSSERNRYLDRIKSDLKGSTFRKINELFYTKHAEDMHLTADQYKSYIEGYEIQRKSWPSDPIFKVIEIIEAMKPNRNMKIADVGCGTARIAEKFPLQTVSYDKFPFNENITHCDMIKVPCVDGHFDVSVYCLSLMSPNMKQIITEANRILKMGGIMIVAEIVSRFEDNPKRFINFLSDMGFKLCKMTEIENYFYTFVFNKTTNETRGCKEFKLKTCLYQKR